MNKCININRIVANGGIAFFSTMAATTFTGDIYSLEISAINALIIAGIALFTELKLETEQEGKIVKIQKALNRALLV